MSKPFVRKPEWAHQKEGRLFMKRRLLEGKGIGIAFKPGRGKSRPTVRIIQMLHKKRGVNLVLVVNTLSGMHVWIDQWDKYADVPALFVDLRESKSEGIRTAEKLAKAGNLVVCLVNYGSSYRIGYKQVSKPKKDGSPGKETVPVDTTLHDVDWDLCVLDEIHNIGNPTGTTGKFFLTKLKPRCRLRVGLTGSLITKRPSKAWAPVKFLTDDEVFPGSFSGRSGPDRYGNEKPTSFLGRYAIMDWKIPGKIERWHNLEDFAQRLARCFHVPDESTMEQKEAIHVYRRVELSSASRKTYDKLTKDLYVELQSWEDEGKAEYARLVDYLASFWRPRLTKTPSTAPKTGLWQWPDEAIFRGDVERDARATILRSFDDGALMVRREDALQALRERMNGFASVTLEHVFSVMRKQQQITAGFVVPDAPEDDPERKMEPIPLGTEKLDALGEELDLRWVEPPAKPEPIVVVVTGNYEQAQVVRYIEKRFKFTPKVLDGSVKGAGKRFAMIAAAAKDPVFVLKAQAGSESIDCQWAETFIFMSKTPHTVQYEQLLARMLRGERTSGTYVHVVANRTVDDRIEEILTGDLNLASRIELDWRKAIVA